jgi:hypothetical protein
MIVKEKKENSIKRKKITFKCTTMQFKMQVLTLARNALSLAKTGDCSLDSTGRDPSSMTKTAAGPWYPGSTRSLDPHDSRSILRHRIFIVCYGPSRQFKFKSSVCVIDFKLHYKQYNFKTKPHEQNIP